MKTIMKYITLFLLFTAISCAQQKNVDKPPKLPSKNYGKIKKPKKLPRLFNSIDLVYLKQNQDSLYCWKIDDECHILDGKTTIFNYYQTTGDDNPTDVPYIFAEGEFFEGKHHDVWKYYDKNGKVTKKEKWDNGKLIYRKEYK